MTGTVPSVDTDTSASPAQPLDASVSRRWLLERAAWVTTAAAGGTLLAPQVASAGELVTAPFRDGAADTVRPEAVSDPTELTIAEALTMFRTRRLTPVELMEAYLARIDQFEPIYLAFNDRQPPEVLLAQAAALGRRPNSRALLWGTAMAPKDNYYTADLLTTGNSPVYSDFRPDYDSTCVARLRASGGLVIGKAQMGPLASGRALLPGTNIPTTRNAWTPDDIRYSPSGSSGGTATSVAARLATSGLGTQTGGSITSPGLAQGLTAFKPTFGRTSLYGVIPLTYTRDHTGPIARDAKDAAIMLQAIAGADPYDPRTIGLPPVPDYIAAATPVVRGRRVRMRWPTTVGIFPGFLTVNDPQQAALRQDSLGVLAQIERLSFVDLTLPDEWDILTGTLASTTGEGTNAFLADMQRDVAQFATRLTGFLAGTLRSASSYLRVLQARYILFQRALETFASQCDLILGGPVGSFDGIGWPLSSFPIGFGTDETTGLTVPRGAIIGGLPYGEERMLALIASYQALTDWHLRRPPDPTATAATTTRASAPELTIDPALEPADEE